MEDKEQALELFLTKMQELGIAEEEEPAGVVRNGVKGVYDIENPLGAVVATVNINTRDVEVHVPMSSR